MTKEELLKKAIAWQEAGFVHPMTCRNDSNHPKLIPFIMSGENCVALKCSACNYIQDTLPTEIIRLDLDALEEERQKLINLGFKLPNQKQ